MTEKFKFLDKNKISLLPKTAGVYCFRAGNKILYIGKAINIRERVKQHKEGFVLNQVKRIGYIETGSEIQALLLEAKLIKRYQPKYNVIWKDDKNYFYVGITKNPLPRVLITHQTSEKCSRYIGPFVEGNALKQVLKILRKIFPYYTLRHGSGQAQKHPDKLCPWCHLNLCPGPNPNAEEYRKNIKNLVLFLAGKKHSVAKNLKKEMAVASKKKDYEKAARLRDQISALEKIISNAKIFPNARHVRTKPWLSSRVWRRVEAYDVSNIQGQYATGSMVVFINGKSDKSQYRKFKIKIGGKPNDVAMIKEVLSRRFNHPEWPYPDLILIDGGKAQLNAAMLTTKNYKSFDPELRTEGLKTKVMSLAKKKNELYIEGEKQPIRLDSLPDSLKFVLLRLRDEAHRFAIGYHHKLRLGSIAS
ncbi:MAG: UvrB/UvrC motif-containing protein [Candidatus Wildermuthbacteria bacterium]|nr:UvrB/UvrC motif-containing protein [Candidatus Wildermuthbacteria bacterium]